MARSVKEPGSDAQSTQPVLKQRKKDQHLLMSKVRALALFPHLRVQDWMPTAREHFQLEANLVSSDSRYAMLHNLCKNARTRMKNKELLRR